MEPLTTTIGTLSLVASKNGKEPYPECQYDHTYMEQLITATNNVGNKIDTVNKSIETLNKSNDQIVKWLLIVVCVIALGRSLLEAVQNVWTGKQLTHVEASK